VTGEHLIEELLNPAEDDLWPGSDVGRLLVVLDDRA
jgi:hypothetical protein